MKPNLSRCCLFALIVGIAIGCSEDPLTPQYSELQGTWAWVRTVGGDDSYTVQTPASTKSKSNLILRDQRLFERYAVFQPGYGRLIGVSSDSLNVQGYVSLIQQPSSLCIEFVEQFVSDHLPLQRYKQRVARLTADTLEFSDIDAIGAFVSTYARVR